MGIKPDIIKEDIGVFSKQCVIPYDSTYKPMDRSAVFFDLTSMLYKLTKPAAKDRTLMTSEEFKDSFRRKLVNLAKWKNYFYASVIVVCLDNPKYVPKEKGATQAARRVAAAKTEQKRVSSGLSTMSPYPKGTVIGPLGLKQPESEQWEVMDTMRLAKSGHMYPQIASHLYEGLQHEEDSTAILMDCFDDGPKWAGGNHSIRNYEGVLIPANAHDIRFVHKIGEADLALMYWTRVFGQEHPIVHVTVDGDEVPIAMSYLRSHAAPTLGWHWIQHWGKPKKAETLKVVDLLQLHRDLVAYQQEDKQVIGKKRKSPPAKETAVKKRKGVVEAAQEEVEEQITEMITAIVQAEQGVVKKPTYDSVELFVLYTLMYGTDYATHTDWTLYAKRPQVWEALNDSRIYVEQLLYWWKRDPTDPLSIDFGVQVMDYVTRFILHRFTKSVCDSQSKPPQTSLFELQFPEYKVEHPKVHPPPTQSLLMQLTKRKLRFPSMPENAAKAVEELRFNFLYWFNQSGR